MDSFRRNPAGRFAGGGLALLLVAAVLYLTFPARVYECDAVIYATAGLAGDREQSTDAGHLAWGFLELGAAQVGTALQPPLHPIFLLRWLAIASALIGIWLFHRVARRSGSGPVAAWLVTGLLAFSYSYWHFGVQAESHLVATVFLIAFAGAAADHFRSGTTGSVVAASVFLSLSTLMHQTGILLVPAFLVPALLRAPDGVRRLRVAAAFLGIYFLLVILPYLGVGWFVRGFRSYGEFREWILGLSLWGMWGDWETTSGVAALIGLGRSIVGSHYLLGIPWIENLAYRLVPNASWEDEAALASAIFPGVHYLLLVVQVVWFGGVIWGLTRVARRLPLLRSEGDSFTAFLVLWLLIYVPFIVWWAPIRAEFWIAVFVPLLLLLGPILLPAEPAGRGARRAARLLVIGLAALNLLGSLGPQANHSVEPELYHLVAIDAVTKPGDFVLTAHDLRGRATRFVYDLDKINLLDPQPWRTTLLSPALQGAPPAGSYDPAQLLPVPRTGDPDDLALGAVAAARQVADREGREVYLAMSCLRYERELCDLYRQRVAAVEAAYELSEPVPVRGDVEWRRVIRPLETPVSR